MVYTKPISSPFRGVMNSLKKSCIIAGLLACAFATAAYCQQTGATLVGTVTDATGAVLPKVAIRASNLATNVVRESVADDSGNYSIPFLPAGDYLVTATLGGFREGRVERVTLQVLQTARVDFQMQPGNVNERVEVSATGALLQTENAAVGTVIDSSKIWIYRSTGATLFNWPN